MTTMTTYEGHPSWNHWNVSLWLANEYELYKLCVSMIRRHGEAKAALILSEEMIGRETPDGAPYTQELLEYAMIELCVDEEE